MSDLFKSAFNYFSAPSNEQSDNSFVGQIIEISNVKLKIKKVIAEGTVFWFIDLPAKLLFITEISGGFAVVFVAQDVSTGKNYALKVIIM